MSCRGLLPVLVWIAAAVGVAAAPSTPGSPASPLDALVLSSNLWDLTRGELTAAAKPLKAYWVSEEQQTARSTAPGASFLGLPVVETLIRVAGEKVSGVDLSFYNRGDVGDIGEDEYAARAASVEKALTALTGAAVRDISGRQDTRHDRVVRTLTWSDGTRCFYLAASHSWRQGPASRKREPLPEFVNLAITPDAGRRVGKVTPQKAVGGAIGLRERVETTPEGDVRLVGIPMVDQGEKGYCAVASTERILRYYGVDASQHDLAQRARTASGGGTDPESLVRAIKGMAEPMGICVRTIEHTDISQIKQLVGDYNRAARKQGVAEVVLPTSGVIMLQDIYNSMDRQTYLLAGRPSQVELNRFSSAIDSKISAGCPLLWGVVLGFVPEQVELPQARGGHMRLIIGHNPKTREVLYSDSWGPGHELKRMGVDDAYAITTGLYTIEPK